ncbi:hypothetical protein LguiA_011832 [Lonicera macranthoides]
MTISLSTLTILSLQILILFIGSFCIHEINGDGVLLQADNKVQREFDYFALALQWPGTYCSKTSKCCSKNACCRGENSPTHFTIHGLWPDYNDGTWPSCCTESEFDEKEISTLLGALEEYWPSLSCGKSKTCSGGKGLFWAHEKNMEPVPFQFLKTNTLIFWQPSISISNTMSRKFYLKLDTYLQTPRSIL